jgi:hypothetical protein
MAVEDDIWEMLEELETDPVKLAALATTASGEVSNKEILRLVIRMYRLQTSAILKLAAEIDSLSARDR